MTTVSGPAAAGGMIGSRKEYERNRGAFMGIWIIAAAIGLAALAYVLWRSVVRPAGGRRSRRASMVLGVLFPVAVAAQFSSLLFDL